MSDDFSQLVGDDVTPIKTEPRVRLEKKHDAAVDKEARRSAAVLDSSPTADPLSGEPVELVAPLDELAYKKPGVQHGVFRRFRLGQYAIDARLDLHRMTVEHARIALTRFVHDCIANGIRTALVTHGKSEGRPTPALMKSCVAYWLPQFDEVLAFHTAQKQHGGYGATYVLLKKAKNA